MKQSRMMSLMEQSLSTAIGFAVALATQLLVFPLFGFHPDISANLAITAIFTFVSIARGYALRRLFEKLHIRVPMSPATLAVIAERQRQKDVEGWTLAHDDAHEPGELARAGAAYAYFTARELHGKGNSGTLTAAMIWPWNKDWWKPRDFRRDLVRAGALIIAEIERFDRMRKQRRA